MSNEPKDPQPDKSSDQIGAGLAMGAGIGTVFGILFDNLAIGIIFGAALGLVFGTALSQKKKR